MKLDSISILTYQKQLLFPNQLLKGTLPNILTSKGNYVKGKKDGFWKDNYDEDCKCYSQGSYSNDVRTGKWTNTYVRVRSKGEIEFRQYNSFESGNFSEVSDKDVTVKVGYTSYFGDKGGFIKCINPDGVDIVEKALYEGAKTIEDYEDFLNKYPNSNYSAEIKENLNRLLKQKKEEETKEKRIIELNSEIENGSLSALIELETLAENTNYGTELKKFKEIYESNKWSNVSVEVPSKYSMILKKVLIGKTDYQNIIEEYFNTPTVVSINNQNLSINSYEITPFSNSSYALYSGKKYHVIYAGKKNYEQYLNKKYFSWEKFNNGDNEFKVFMILCNILQYDNKYCYTVRNLTIIISQIFDVDDEVMRKSMCEFFMKKHEYLSACTKIVDRDKNGTGDAIKLTNYTPEFKKVVCLAYMHWINGNITSAQNTLDSCKEQVNFTSYTSEGDVWRKWKRSASEFLYHEYKKHLKGYKKFELPSEKAFIKSIK